MVPTILLMASVLILNKHYSIRRRITEVVTVDLSGALGRLKGLLLGTLRKFSPSYASIGSGVKEYSWTDTVHIYVGGQRIAREECGSVSFEHHNPVTGSWVTSNGHSSSRTTTREERDPRGAEVPLENPYPSAQSYVDWKSTQPLFIEGGDPFDYTSGRTIDGLPVSEAEFQRRVGNGSAGAGVFRGGKFTGFVDLSRLPSVTHIDVTFDVFRSGQPVPRPDWWVYRGIFTKEFNLDPRVGLVNHHQSRSDSNPKQDRKLKFPEVTETGRPLSECAQGILRKFLEDGPYWKDRDRGFRVIDKIQLYSGIPDLVTKYALITPVAVTYGNGVFLKSGMDPANLDNFFGLTLLAHETAHAIQADKYGGAVVFGALYLARSATVRLKGKDAYQDNKYEVEAREFEDAFRTWLEKQYGREDPCKEFRGGN